VTAQRVRAEVSINNAPEAVLGYVADVRNRTFFLPSLKSLSEVQGAPIGADTTWQWTWVLFGMEFVGTGRSLEYQPGRLYSFQTEGGIASTWTYRVAKEGQGTRLTIDVEYQAPDTVLGRIRGGSQASHKAEIDLVTQNLKTILDK
jgi:hypothetical protein